MSSKPAFCANCVEERTDLAARRTDAGRTVWICPDCDDPVLAMRIHDVAGREGGSGAVGLITRQAGRRTGAA